MAVIYCLDASKMSHLFTSVYHRAILIFTPFGKCLYIHVYKTTITMPGMPVSKQTLKQRWKCVHKTSSCNDIQTFVKYIFLTNSYTCALDMKDTFDEELGPKCEIYFYSVVLELFLCYSYLTDSSLRSSIFAQFLLCVLDVYHKPSLRLKTNSEYFRV